MNTVAKMVTVTVFVIATMLAVVGCGDTIAGTRCDKFGEYAQKTTSDSHHYTCRRRDDGLVWVKDW